MRTVVRWILGEPMFWKIRRNNGNRLRPYSFLEGFLSYKITNWTKEDGKNIIMKIRNLRKGYNSWTTKLVVHYSFGNLYHLYAHLPLPYPIASMQDSWDSHLSVTVTVLVTKQQTRYSKATIIIIFSYSNILEYSSCFNMIYIGDQLLRMYHMKRSRHPRKLSEYLILVVNANGWERSTILVGLVFVLAECAVDIGRAKLD